MSRENRDSQSVAGWYSNIRENLQSIDPNSIMQRSDYSWIDEDTSAVSRPVSITRMAPEGGEVIHRVMSPDTDPFMDNEELASSIRDLDDSAVAILLLIGHAKLSSEPQISRYLNGLSQNGEQVISRSGCKKQLRELVGSGILSRVERKGDQVGDRKKQVTYSIPEENRGILAKAGHLAQLSVSHDAALRGIFGNAESGRGEDRYMDDEISHTMDRIRVIRLLNDGRRENGAYNPLPVTATFVANELGIAYQRAAAHLRALEGIGAVDYESVNSAKGSYQKYKRNPEVGLGRTSSDTQHAILGLAEVKPEGFTTYLASVYAASQSPDDLRDLSEDEWRTHYDSVRKSIYNLASRGVLDRESTMGKDIKMVLRFKPLSGQLQLIRDTVISLFQVQREDADAVEEGISLGKKISQDRNQLAALAGKISRVNEQYRERSVPRESAAARQ